CLLNDLCFVAPSLAGGEARGGSIPRSGAVTDEQRSHRPNWAQPKWRQSFSLQASLLAPYRSTAGYARRSRLAWREKSLPQNTSHLGDTTLVVRRPSLQTKRRSAASDAKDEFKNGSRRREESVMSLYTNTGKKAECAGFPRS